MSMGDFDEDEGCGSVRAIIRNCWGVLAAAHSFMPHLVEMH